MPSLGWSVLLAGGVRGKLNMSVRSVMEEQTGKLGEEEPTEDQVSIRHAHTQIHSYTLLEPQLVT